MITIDNMKEIKYALLNNEINPILTTYYASEEEAISKMKLDKRHKWYEFMGELIRDGKYKMTCWDCGGIGCQTCGYKMNTWQKIPIPALDKNNGNPVKILKIK